MPWCAVGRALATAGRERAIGQPDQRKITASRMGLNPGPMCSWPWMRWICWADPDQPSVGIDVSPAQAEHFTAAHAIQQQEHERRIERIVSGGLEEGDGLARGPRHDRAGFPGGQLDERATLRGTSFSRRAVHDGACPTQQHPRTSGGQPGSVSSPASARWPTYSSSGSASWALDVDIGAGVFQQTDPLQVDSW
jgi:hypothetical protein